LQSLTKQLFSIAFIHSFQGFISGRCKKPRRKSKQRPPNQVIKARNVYSPNYSTSWACLDFQYILEYYLFLLNLSWGRDICIYVHIYNQRQVYEDRGFCKLSFYKFRMTKKRQFVHIKSFLCILMKIFISAIYLQHANS
jgi:hypothetical protein